MTIDNSYGENLVNSRLQPLSGYNTYADNKFRLSNKSISSWSFDGDVPALMKYVPLWDKDTASFNIKPGQNMIFTEDEENPYVRQIIEVYTNPDELFTNSVDSNLTAPSQIIIESATGNGTQITYVAENNLQPGNTVTISGMSPTGYNLSNVEVVSATSTEFVVLGTETTPSTVGGVLTVVKAFNSDVYIKYLDDQYIEQIKTISVQFDADGYPRDQIYLVTEDWENRNIGSSGWMITSEGNSIFNNVAVRGDISAQSGNFEGFLTVNNGTMKIGSGVDTTEKYNVSKFQIINEEVILTIGSHAFNVGDQVLVENVDSLSAVFSLFPPPADITGAVGNGTQVTYTANNTFITGSTVAIIGTNPVSFEVESAEIVSATATQFTIASTVTDTYSSGGIAIINTIPIAGTDINGTYIISGITTSTIKYSLQAPDFPETIVSYGSVSGGTEKDGIYINTDNYWFSDGTISIGEGNKSITYDGADVVIGADVIINASLTADSLTVGTSPSILTISDNSNGLGDAGIYINTNNHWYSDGHFKVGNSTNYVEWEGSALIVKGTLNDLELSRGGGNIATNFAVGIDSLNNNTTGENNIALGQESLFSNITGSGNIGVGYRALYSNVTSNNIAIGAYSLSSNTTGQNNIAIGLQSLKNNITGRLNVAIGLNSLFSNTVGTQNIAIGSSSLSSNVSGNSNVAIGIESLIQNTAGSANIAIGLQSLQLNQTGNFNVSIGDSTLLNNKASNNVAIGSTSLYTNTTGTQNIGIGAFSLQANTTGSYNSAIGFQSLLVNETGSYNLAIGYQSLYLNKASYNFAIGASSLYSNTTGTNNIALGYQSLLSNVTGSNNIAIGYRSLYSNKTDANLAIGDYALFSTTTGQVNLAIGINSMYSNTQGFSNVAIGYYSLYSNTTGAFNMAIGESALYGNTTGAYNTAIGFRALENAISGNNNTAIGTIALKNNFYGSNNVAIGNDTLSNNMSGDGNIAIGPRSLKSNTAGYNLGIGYDSLLGNTTGIYNIAIGFSSLSSNITGSNNVAIGYESLRFNKGNKNFAIGYRSLYTNTDGIQNVALGEAALYSNTTGQNNVAIGYGTLASNTTGVDNIAIGIGTLPVNTFGKENIAVGMYSLNANVSGEGNTAIGQYALANNVHESYNVAVGGGALTNLSGFNDFSHSNVAIGVGAGSSITDGSQNVFIGLGAGANYEFGNYSVFIGGPADVSSYSGLDSHIILSDGFGNIALVIDGGQNASFQGQVSATVDSAPPFYMNRVTGTTSAPMIQFYRSGVPAGTINASTTAAPTLVAPSDYRLKENIEDYSGALDLIKQLRPRTYNFINDENTTSVLGFIAHEYADVFPQFVLGEKDAVDKDGNPEYQSIETTSIIPYLIAALKESIEKIENLEARLAQIENS